MQMKPPGVVQYTDRARTDKKETFLHSQNFPVIHLFRKDLFWSLLGPERQESRCHKTDYVLMKLTS